jgi:multiple sugar transport system substrate-binding protein
LDVARFDKTVLNTVTDEKGIYAIPFAVQLYALYYNKDIFDKFAVAYPRDGMTWDDTIELARKVTRTEDGTPYRGLDTGDINRIKLTKSLAIVDAKTGKASVNNDQWKQAFQMLHRIYSIPGNAPGKFAPHKDFIENKVIAMWPAWNILDELSALPPGSLNWDMAQYPSYKETPNTYFAVDTRVVFITKTSKNKEAAFKVIQTLTSDEVQLLSARETGRLTPLVNRKIRDALAELPVLKGKNIQGVLKSRPAPAPNYTKYEQSTQKILVQAFKDYFDKGKDLNTVLRETDEEVNKYIEENER